MNGGMEDRKKELFKMLQEKEEFRLREVAELLIELYNKVEQQCDERERNYRDLLHNRELI